MISSLDASFSFAVAEEIVLKHFIGTARDFGCFINALRTESCPGRTIKPKVRELSDEQVMCLMQGLTIDPKINTAKARELY